ncbi:D,L-glycerol 3-phosphate phosphatase [Frankia canadensis]|uniref:D,L-glycerol 3-phosphate phosphatase n=1 Tax=Frankia canadensis TaxID=1836972 RepID=A0A2I2KTA9_9ACTN|nr:HAD-IIA family hydrolase [Frankia canadensis]SNQ48892.1 D,L-glycerol 3-phosphate phosphatase [Frankia canadensis]SOU56182.1 D,L-glycerol 3-phosphate phosphatase [Frankia canadensis]
MNLPDAGLVARPRAAAGAEPLRGTDGPLAALFDVALMDLDGVVNRGGSAVPHAADAIAAAGRRGLRTIYVTNNALRPPAEVAARLTGFGVPATAEDVVTSAQAAAHVLAARLPAGARVLVLGGRGLRQAVVEEGLTPVDSADDEPAAVVQGFDPELTYARIAEAAYAIRAGAWWVLSNADRTVPSERGIAPGNGSIAALLRSATDRDPLVTGKPEVAMHQESMRRSGARQPIIVGDRLDTDIEAGTRSGTPTLLVLTGVTTLSDLLAASPPHRPTYLAADLRGLLRPAPAAGRVPAAGPHAACCGPWLARVEDGVLSWSPVTPAGGTQAGPEPPADDLDLDAARAACTAAWAAADDGAAVHTIAAQRPACCSDLAAPASRR